jgi:hypothetical protein
MPVKSRRPAADTQPVRRVQPVYLVLVLAAAVAAAVVPSVLHLRAAYSQAQATHRLALANKLNDPDGLVAVKPDHDTCLGESAVRCAYAKNGDVDALGALARKSLSRVTAQPATLRCQTITGSDTVPRRMCLAQAFQGAITVSVETHVRRSGDRIVAAGADYRVDAS